MIQVALHILSAFFVLGAIVSGAHGKKHRESGEWDDAAYCQRDAVLGLLLALLCTLWSSS